MSDTLFYKQILFKALETRTNSTSLKPILHHADHTKRTVSLGLTFPSNDDTTLATTTEFLLG